MSDCGHRFNHRYDWLKAAVWTGCLLFCLIVWAGVIIGLATVGFGL